MQEKRNRSDRERNNKHLKKSEVKDIQDRKLNTTKYLYSDGPVEQNDTIKSYLLQTTKILAEAEIKDKYRGQLTSWVDEFQLFLNSLPIHNAINISSFSRKAFSRPSRDMRFVKNLANHSKNNLCCDEDISVTFIRPECVGTFGLFKINALPGPNIEINLHMTMPKKCFQDKDSLNNRYFIKKFFYLMYLAEHLTSNNICATIKCAYYNESVLLPYLILCPNINERITVKLFLVPEQNYFEANEYSPEVNNVNVQVFEQVFGRIDNIEKFPTTFYNSGLGFDVTLAENNVFIEQMFSTSIHFQEGLKLIVIWMNQRKLNNGLGAFTTDLVIYCMAYMISKREINKNMSTYEVFKTFLYFIHSIDLEQTPISICEEISLEELQKFKSFFDIVLMDKTGTYNTAAFLNINAYQKMKHECKLALAYLDQCSNSISDLFLINVPLYLQYDALIDVKNDNNYEMLKSVDPKERAKYFGNHMLLIMKVLQEYLNRGFHKRVINIVPIGTHDAEWEYGVRYKISNCRIIFGIQLNVDFAFNMLEFGPELKGDENNFAEFWSRLACITWFHDDQARILFQFKADTMKDKRNIIRTISNYIMTEKLHLNHKCYYNELEYFLMDGKMVTWYPSGTNEETSGIITETSDNLAQKIKSLDIQPGIVDIRGLSDVFCYTDVFPPIPCSYTCDERTTILKERNMILKDHKLKVPLKYVEPIECVIQMADSCKLPDNLNILQEVKTGILVNISELLSQEYNIVSSVKPPYLDVLYKGIVFRYSMYLPKEINLMKSTMRAEGLEILPHNEMIFEFEKKNIVVPKIVAALKGINTQNPSYGLSTCLAKRWIRAQLIDDFLLPDMVINLLNAHQYLNKTLYTPAVAPQQTFLRFLKFLLEVEWDQEPVVINLNNELAAEKISKVKTAMRKNRGGFPALFILTPYDDGNSVFTKAAPCGQVLIRLKVLATEFLNYVKNIIMDESLYSWKELFIPNRRGFNCILHLKYLSNPRIHEQISGIDFSNEVLHQPTEDNQYLPLVNFNPVQMYLKELRTNYGDCCVFFHDTYGGNFIGVLWKPGFIESKEDIKRGFAIFGKDLLKSVEVIGE